MSTPPMKKVNMIQQLKIGERDVGPGCPVYVVAEMSGNHNQSFECAVEIIRAAKRAGADAIKVQTYTPDTLTIDSDNECFRIKKGTLWEGRTLYALYSEAFTPWEWQPKLKVIASELGMDFFSTPFDSTAVEFLEDIGIPAYKIASFELVDIPLLKKVAATGKPIVLSTGMATFEEIELAAQTLRKGGCVQLALLKCTSAYPSLPESMNLRTIPHMVQAFGVPVGLSDHTLGDAIPVAAVTLGACIVEKHFTLSRSAGGPDSAFSLEPDEFKRMVNAIRESERALGEVRYEVSRSEEASRVFRRSLFVVKDMKAGDAFTDDNVKSIRPGYGLHTKFLPDVLGRQAREDIKRGSPLEWRLLK